MSDNRFIRNFCIIAHIDHGKSTLADRILERTGALPKDRLVAQVLDQMDLERERGITIKASAIRTTYDDRGQEYTFNLIDTPGHVDFAYEVSRALAACEGAILVVDASEGVQAQTLANHHLATQQDLKIIPVISKIDLPTADVEAAAGEIEQLLGLPRPDILLVSGKTGEGVERLLQAIPERLPPPTGDPAAPLRALVFDSYFDRHRGVVVFIRLFDGQIESRQKIKFMGGGGVFEVSEIGTLGLGLQPAHTLAAGEVGYLMAGIKDVREARIGDTITLAARPASQPLQGYRAPKPMVFCGFYPVEPGKYSALSDALDKLSLNDAALHYEGESSVALGLGFRCGFLGLLHLDIAQERLEREYGLEILATAPSVVYLVGNPGQPLHEIRNPAEFPEPVPGQIIREPYVRLTLTCPIQYIGPSMELTEQYRGQFLNISYHQQRKVTIEYDIPLSEILFHFFDQLKARTSGYASYDYEFLEYRDADLVRLTVIVNDDPVDALSAIVHRNEATGQGRKLVEQLRRLIPRQLFEVRIQAAAGHRIIASERIPARRKHVTAKCYGGDITRKRKLLERQKEGKKRMRQVGKVEVPQEAFLSILKIRE